MVRSQIPESHRRAQGDTTAWIVTAHDARQIVTTGIQTVNRDTVGVEHLRMFVTPQACKSSQTSSHNAHGIKRPILQRCHARIAACMAGIALHAVVSSLALGKLTVVANVRHGVVARHRSVQVASIDAALFR